MKKFYSFFQRKVITGLLMLLPLTILALLVARLWDSINLVGNNINSYLGIQSWVGTTLLVLLTGLSLIVVCFLTGIIVQMLTMSAFRFWLERKLLKYLPGYSYVHMMLDEKLGLKLENKTCVLVRLRSVWQPGVLIEENEFCAVVYLPNCPQPGVGTTCIVDLDQIKHVNISVSSFNSSMEHFGAGLADVYKQFVGKNMVRAQWRN